jgi:hypothetical protein
MHTTSIARLRATQARNSTTIVEGFWGQVFADRGWPFPREEFQERVARHFIRRPPRGVSRESVAVHESSHFVTAHLERFGACSAEIFGSRHGWGGCAASIDAPCPTDPRELLGEARVVVAGPIAVELLGDVGRGGAADNIEELLKARFILARAAELAGRRKGSLWRGTLIEAAQRVEFFAPEICDLGAVLARRKTIHASSPTVKRVLRRVDAKSGKDLSPLTLSLRCENILADIDAILSEFLP